MSTCSTGADALVMPTCCPDSGSYAAPTLYGSSCTPATFGLPSTGTVTVCDIPYGTNGRPPVTSASSVGDVCTFQRSTQQWYEDLATGAGTTAMLFHGLLGKNAYAVAVDAAVPVMNASTLNATFDSIPAAPGPLPYAAACSSAMGTYDTALGTVQAKQAAVAAAQTALTAAQASASGGSSADKTAWQGRVDAAQAVLKSAQTDLATAQSAATAAKGSIETTCFPSSDMTTSSYTGYGKVAYELRRQREDSGADHTTCELENMAGYLVCRTLLETQLGSDVAIFNQYCKQEGSADINVDLASFRDDVASQLTKLQSKTPSATVTSCMNLGAGMLQAADAYTRMWQNPALSGTGATWDTRCSNLALNASCGVMLSDQATAVPPPAVQPPSGPAIDLVLASATAACMYSAADGTDATSDLQQECDKYGISSTLCKPMVDQCHDVVVATSGSGL